MVGMGENPYLEYLKWCIADDMEFIDWINRYENKTFTSIRENYPGSTISDLCGLILFDNGEEINKLRKRAEDNARSVKKITA